MSTPRPCDACGRFPLPCGFLAVDVEGLYEDHEVDVCGWECLHRWAGDRVADELRGRELTPQRRPA